MLHFPMDMKFCKYVLNLLRYNKINFDHYTYMKKKIEISLLKPQFA
jgi:hypothetical protein